MYLVENIDRQEYQNKNINNTKIPITRKDIFLFSFT